MSNADQNADQNADCPKGIRERIGNKRIQVGLSNRGLADNSGSSTSGTGPRNVGEFGPIHAGHGTPEAAQTGALEGAHRHMDLIAGEGRRVFRRAKDGTYQYGTALLDTDPKLAGRAGTRAAQRAKGHARCSVQWDDGKISIVNHSKVYCHPRHMCSCSGSAPATAATLGKARDKARAAKEAPKVTAVPAPVKRAAQDSD